jgi:hypothetical protein
MSVAGRSDAPRLATQRADSKSFQSHDDTSLRRAARLRTAEALTGTYPEAHERLCVSGQCPSEADKAAWEGTTDLAGPAVTRIRVMAVASTMIVR